MLSGRTASPLGSASGTPLSATGTATGSVPFAVQRCNCARASPKTAWLPASSCKQVRQERKQRSRRGKKKQMPYGYASKATKGQKENEEARKWETGKKHASFHCRDTLLVSAARVHTTMWQLPPWLEQHQEHVSLSPPWQRGERQDAPEYYHRCLSASVPTKCGNYLLGWSSSIKNMFL